MVFAARDPGVDLAGLPGLEVAGLGETDARALLEAALAGPMDARVRDLIIAETRGNPLALLELPRGLTPAELAGGFGLPAAAPLTSRIEDSFRRQLDAIPAETRRLLQLAAADPSGDRALVWRAARRLGIPVQAATAATEAGLAEFSDQVRFRHPLARSAVYRSASLSDRQQMHAALAEVTDPQADPDRRAWHRAQAAGGPDEEVAAELERSAGRAQARGGLAAAAAFLARAGRVDARSGAADSPGGPSTRASPACRQGHSTPRAPCSPSRAKDRPTSCIAHASTCCVPGWHLHRAGATTRHHYCWPRPAGLNRWIFELARETYLDAFMAAMFGARLNEGTGVRAR